MIWCAITGLATAAALWIARPDDALLLHTRLQPDATASWVVPAPEALAVPIGVCAILMIPSTVTQIAAVATLGAVGFGVVLYRQAIRRRGAREFRAETAVFLRAWSAELRSGLTAVDAARAAVRADPAGESVWNPVRLATSVDIPDALLAIAELPGGESLVDAAAAWSIADSTGAPLAAVLERVSEAVQAAVDLDREVAVEAAPARATARLMALLPLVGILLGTTLGADPLGVLFGTALGVGCLALGLALAGVGVWWIERLVAGVEP